MPDELMFPKKRMVRMTIDANAENFEEQLAASMARIEKGVHDVQETLNVLVAVLAMDEEDPPAVASPFGRPRDVGAAIGAYLVGSMDERALREALSRACEVPHDPRD